MKYVTVREIDANDCKPSDYHPLVPVLVVLLLATLAQGFFSGCADTDDDEGNDPVVEVDGGVRVPRDGYILPYKPGLPAVIEQALVNTPDYVYTDGVIAPSYAPGWTIATGGLQQWTRVSYGTGANAYRTKVNAVLGYPLYWSDCVRDSSANPTMVCHGVRYACPTAVTKDPIAYEHRGSGVVYGFDRRYYVTQRGFLQAATVAVRWPAGGLPYLECSYNTGTLTQYITTK